MSILDRIPTNVKVAAGAVAAVGAIISGYLSVEAWAQERLDQTQEVLRKEQAVVEAKHDLIHDFIYQTNRVQYNESQLKIAELQLQQMEEEIAYKRQRRVEVTDRELRSMERLLKSVEYYEEQLREANANLSNIETVKAKKGAE